MEDLEARGGWETFGKEEKTQEIQQSRAEHILVSAVHTWFYPIPD
jgi:hypothetical protein